jgi:hypothetical protein
MHGIHEYMEYIWKFCIYNAHVSRDMSIYCGFIRVCIPLHSHEHAVHVATHHALQLHPRTRTFHCNSRYIIGYPYTVSYAIIVYPDTGTDTTCTDMGRVYVADNCWGNITARAYEFLKQREVVSYLRMLTTSPPADTPPPDPSISACMHSRSYQPKASHTVPTQGCSEG